MPITRNIKITLAYDGSAFFGWQIQPGQRTVQGTLEGCLSRILGHRVSVIAAGRTDTGVHALSQVINVHTHTPIPTDRLLSALNNMLPHDITALSADTAAPEFHARYMTQSKQYVYIIDTAGPISPFLSRYVLHVEYKIDMCAMEKAAGYFVGEHDFTSFMGTGSCVKTTLRRVRASEVIQKKSKIYYFIEGDGFLRHMVRNIVGTLLLVARGKLDPDDIPQIIKNRDRSCAGPTAPARGLYLFKVNY
ncbi:MAG: tRNA pseudouridine(38-40) synthase TruA [Deltaproteobacteria bacterium]|nr:tRNA pseudouridine(38-40) synthase TruA [Deltaproteobacteria bacterium]